METKEDSEVEKWELVGTIGVDAGMCWIGDPCYVLHADPTPKAIGKDWDEFCDLLEDSKWPAVKQFTEFTLINQ